ncbi:MAG: hypothetical protein H0U67_01190 [Gemmatimonadetes bacterium]|nr:hypothetical protein [Gemmatimonadota bacterium]
MQDELHTRERLSAIGHAMASVGHCMKNMLTGLKGGVFLLERTMEDTKDSRLSDAHLLLSRSTSRINLLLLNMLDLSRERRAGAVLTSVQGILDETVQVIRAGLAVERENGKEVEIQARLDPAIPMVRLDPERLYRALLNLGLNATDAMPSGGRLLFETRGTSAQEVEASLTGGFDAPDSTLDPAWRFVVMRGSQLSSVRHLRIDIRDNGTGIDPENLQQLFRPFFSTKSSKGTGLGLAAVCQFVTEHDGHILVLSALNHGTRFTLFLPESSE